MQKLLVSLFLVAVSLGAQTHPLQQIVDAARVDSPELANLLGRALPRLRGRDGVLVWGQEFFFAVESETPAKVIIDKRPAREMKHVAGTKYYYLLKTLQMGRTHQYLYVDANGDRIGGYEVASYNTDAYPMPGVPSGTISEMKTLTSEVYPGMTSNYWVYVNPGADMENGAPLMVWQDGDTILGNQDLLRLRLQIVSDNLVAKGLIPPMVHVLIQPGTVGTRRLRSIQYDTVSDVYGKYILEEVLVDVEKTYKIRQDSYSRAIAGASSGAICAFNVAWYYPQEFSRVLSHIGSFSAIQWHPEENQPGGYIVSHRVRREDRKNIRIWMSDGADDIENGTGSWPLNNIELANGLKRQGYDFHFRFGTSLHAIAQGAMDLPESLVWLWRDYDPTKIEQVYEMEEEEKALPLFRVGVVNRPAW